MGGLIPKGTVGETLPSITRITFGPTKQAGILTSTVDPTSVAVDAEIGTLLQNTSTGEIYRKTDSGSSINWIKLKDDELAGFYAAVFSSFADDTEYITEHGAVSQANGSIYWNTTNSCLRTYCKGQWVNLPPMVEWDNDVPYVENQVVISSSKSLYKCLTGHTSNAAGTIDDDIIYWELIGILGLSDISNVDLDTDAPIVDSVLTYDGANWVPTDKGSLDTALILKELTTTPDTPDTGYMKLYAKDDKRLYILDDTGTETMLEVPLNIVDLFDNEYIDASTIEASTGSPVEVVASLADLVRRMQIADTSGLFLGWYTGASGAEALVAVSGPGTDQTVDIEIASGTRVSVQSITTDIVTSGKLTANFLG